MKVLFLEWKSFGNEYMLETLAKKGFEVVRFPFPRESENTRNSEHLATSIATELLKGGYTQVFSFNYFPVAAIACKACKIPYVAWVYDSPFIQLYSQTIQYETNHVFLFDSTECARLKALGVDTVNFLPMAGADKWYDKMVPNKEHHQKYDCDIAFIGSTYMEEKQHMFRHLKDLDPYTKGYLDGAMQMQKGLYGCNFLEQILTPDIVENMRKVCPVQSNGDGFETVEWILARYFLDRKVTAMERQEILEVLSDRYCVNLYTPEKTPQLPKIHNKGKIDYYLDAPYAMKCAKINLNISLRSIVDGIPLRAFDIMSAGGFLMTNYQADFLQFFVPDEDFVYFEDLEDLQAKVDYYLSHDIEREQIARNGYEKVKKFHSYDVRVEQMFGL